MRLFNVLPRYLYDPDDPGGTGDPGDPAVVTPPAPAPDLKAVSDSIRAAILESRAPVAPTVAPVATPGPSEAVRAALTAESATVNTKFNEMVNAGQAAEAMAMREEFAQRAGRLLATSPEDSPIVKTAVALGERVARTEHAAVMSRWGDEVRRTVEALPIEERVLPDAWDRAVSRIKANHFDELLNEQVTARVEEARKTFTPPPMPSGSRGARRLEGPAAKLSEEQLWGADLCGVDPKDYAAEVAREAAYDALPFKERGPFPGYPLLENTVKPGQF